MKILKGLIIENEMAEMKKTILELHKQYYSRVKELNESELNEEGVLDFQSDDLGFMFDEAKKRFQAASRAIKIANKLGDPVQKSRVFSNFNRLRAFVKRLQRTIEDDLENLEAQLRPSRTFDERAVRHTPSRFGNDQGRSIPPNDAGMGRFQR